MTEIVLMSVVSMDSGDSGNYDLPFDGKLLLILYDFGYGAYGMNLLVDLSILKRHVPSKHNIVYCVLMQSKFMYAGLHVPLQKTHIVSTMSA